MKILQFPGKQKTYTEEEIFHSLTADQCRIYEAAKDGNMHCMRGMAELFESWWHRALQREKPIPGPKGDADQMFHQAICWRKRAAKAGDAESMRWMAVYLSRYGAEYGITDEMAGGSCLQWQERAAEGGDSYAMKWMGDLCADHMDIHYDQVKAEFWYRQSANSGCVYAIHELGLRREKGIHGDQSFAKALHWYKKSVAYIDRWCSLSVYEREVCVDDLIRAAELSIRLKELDDLRFDWLMDYLDRVDRYMDWEDDPEDRAKQIRKVRMKLQTHRPRTEAVQKEN